MKSTCWHQVQGQTLLFGLLQPGANCDVADTNYVDFSIKTLASILNCRSFRNLVFNSVYIKY